MSDSARYIIPGDVLLLLAVSVRQAFDALSAAALAKQHEDETALVVALQYLHARLDTIHQSLLAVAGEQSGNEVTNGSH